MALSVGDSKADASMFAESRLSLAPRNADLAVRQSGVPVLNGYYQKGLAEAVSQVIGHRPLKCFVCSTGVLSKETRLLLTALSAQENGIRSVPLQVARLAGLALSGFLR